MCQTVEKLIANDGFERNKNCEDKGNVNHISALLSS